MSDNEQCTLGGERRFRKGANVIAIKCAPINGRARAAIRRKAEELAASSAPVALQFKARDHRSVITGSFSLFFFSLNLSNGNTSNAAQKMALIHICLFAANRQVAFFGKIRQMACVRMLRKSLTARRRWMQKSPVLPENPPDGAGEPLWITFGRRFLANWIGRWIPASLRRLIDVKWMENVGIESSR